MNVSRLAVLALLLLSPICAEYVSGYDSSTGDPVELLGGLVIFVPLYGAAAVIIRETARRLELGWVGILLLATAFGVLQAGVIDQSMFNDSYRGIDYWDQLRLPTLIPVLGTSGFQVLAFVGTHVINSIGLPVLAIEMLAGARRRTTPWLGRPGLVIAAVAFVAAAAFVLGWHLQTETFRASAGQLVGASVVVVVLIVAAVGLGRRSTAASARRAGAAPPWWAVLVGSFAAAVGFAAVPMNWLGVVLGSAIVAGVLIVVWHWSRRPGWTDRHRAALLGALVPTALTGFLTDPVGEVDPSAQLIHNVTMTLGTLLLLAMAVWRSHRHVRRG